MELQLLGLLLSFLLFAAALRKLWRPRFRGAERSSRNLQQAAEEAKKLALPLPPGSLGFPIIGETLELLRLQRRGLPWSFFHHRISRYGETFKTNLLGSPSVVLASPQGNKTAFSSIYVSWPSSVISVIGTHALVAKVGPEAARIRIALMAFLQPESLRKYTAIVDRLLFAFIRKHLHGKPDVVLFPFMKELAFSIACHVLTGRDDVKDHATLLAPFNTMLKGLFEIPVNIPGTRYRKALAASKEIRKKLQVWIDERRRDLDARSVVQHGDNILTGLVEYRDAEGHPFSDDEIKDNIIGLLFAAHDTSAIVATITCKYLASNPDIMDEVYRGGFARRFFTI
jgi:cytochrome P450 family 26 subfamily A